MTSIKKIEISKENINVDKLYKSKADAATSSNPISNVSINNDEPLYIDLESGLLIEEGEKGDKAIAFVNHDDLKVDNKIHNYVPGELEEHESGDNYKKIVVPTGDKYNTIVATIAHESGGKDPEEVRAVTDVIINRVRSEGYADDMYDVVTGKDQFQSFFDGHYKEYLDANGNLIVGTTGEQYLTPECLEVINEEFDKAASGLSVTYPYKNFRSPKSESFSQVRVTENGNRYQL